MTHLSTLLALGAAVALMSPIGHAQIVPGGPGHLKKFDLKVEIRVQQGSSYFPFIVPSNTVTSTLPTNIIKCPSNSGLANTSTGDCSELGLPSNSNITLLRSATPPANAQFVKWMDIGLSGAMSISNCGSAMAPSITCSMAGLRGIRAVYECDKGYEIPPHSQKPTCEKIADPLGSLSTSKKVAVAPGSPPYPPNTLFQVTVACTPGGPTSPQFTLTDGGAPYVVNNIAAGRVCKVTEQDPVVDPYYVRLGCSWTTSYPNGQNVTMTSPATAMYNTVVNLWSCKEQKPTSFQIVKNTGTTVIPGTYKFDLSCTVGNTPVSVTSPVQIVLPGTGFTTISVPSGASCVVTEQSPGTNWNTSPTFGASGSLPMDPSVGLAVRVGPVTGTSGILTVNNERKPASTDCPDRTQTSIGCRLTVLMKRNKGPAIYSVIPSQAATYPMSNTLPSTGAACVIAANATINSTSCWFNYSASSTTITLSTASSAGPAPLANWTGDCTSSTPQATCTVSAVTQATPRIVTVTFP